MHRIDLSDLKTNTLTQQFLFALFKQNPEIVVFTPGRDYTISHPNGSPPITFQLPNIIYQHLCNPDGKHKGESRYEVVSDEDIDPDHKGKIFPILFTLDATQAEGLVVKEKPPEKKRAVKIEPLQHNYTYQDVIKTYEIAHLLGELAVKPPSLGGGRHGNIATAYSTMRLLGGQDLFMELILFVEGLPEIEKDKESGDVYIVRNITTEEGLLLARAILQALQKMHAKDIVHRDFKLENIRVIPQSATNEKKMIIMDFNLAKYAIDDDRDVVAGTRDFVAPEAFKGEGTTKKSDIYAAGKILKQVFSQCKNMSVAISGKIKKLTDSMILPNPALRPSLERLIEDLNALFEELKRENGNRYALTQILHALAYPNLAGMFARASMQTQSPFSMWTPPPSPPPSVVAVAKKLLAFLDNQSVVFSKQDMALLQSDPIHQHLIGFDSLYILQAVEVELGVPTIQFSA